MIAEFKDVRKDYMDYIRAKLGYTKKYVEKQSMNYSKKNFQSVKKTNQF